jgi:hypothetical protein
MPLNVNEEYNFIELEAEGLKPYYWDIFLR